MNLEKISKQELNDIDLDIYSLMKKMPNNELYNSVYIRWEKENQDTFIRLLCNVDDLTGLLGALIWEDDKTSKKPVNNIVEPSKFAILNLAIHILKEKSDDEVNEFLDLLKDIRCGVR
jgi:hypothetical protein